jgi:riboflavin kinase/FMN adenylyltransferase
MQLARMTSQFPFHRVQNGSVATIGAYDGLHVGHTRLLKRVIDRAKSLGVPSVVMSFEPTPKEFMSSESPPARLMRFREKFEALSDAGIDIFFCPRFDQQMKSISVDTFIRQILVHALNVRHLVVGDDFQFAAARRGTTEHLRRAGIALDFSIEQVASVVIGDERVSSTGVRQALWQGRLDTATRWLGRPYQMSGKVILGEKIGRTLGFPTANVNLRRRQSPVMGIFAVRVRGVAEKPLDAVASVGTRPTFAGTKPLLEVHIFNFDEDIYGEYIHVDFIARIRDEIKFDEVGALVEQMHLDSDRAKKILAEYGQRTAD